MASTIPSPTRILPQPTPGMPSPTLPPFFFNPEAFAAEVAKKAGQRDLAIVFALITLVIPLFVVSIRIFHPRRIRQYELHDILVFIATGFAVVATAAIISTLKTGVKPDGFPVDRKALVASVATTMNFYMVITLARASLLIFAMREFGCRTQKQGCQVAIIRAVILIMMTVVIVQGFSATIITLAGCSPISSAWQPRTFRRDCLAYSRFQVINAGTDVASYFLVLTGLLILYVRTGMQRRIMHFKICILGVGLITVVAGAIRIAFHVGHLKEILPPVKHVEPQILEAVEMDLSITTAALLTLCASIRRQGSNEDQDDVELNRGWKKSVQTSYLDMPDLEFKSENKITGLQGRKDELDMLDDELMLESPTIPVFPHPLSQAVIPSRTPSRTTTLSRAASVSRTATLTEATTPASKPISQPPSLSKPLPSLAPKDRSAIPPMPFIFSTDTSPLEAPPQVVLARRISIASTSSSSLSSGPFSDGDVDDGEALILSLSDEDEDEDALVGNGKSSKGAPGVRFADTKPPRRRSVMGLIDALREVPPGTAITTGSGKGNRRQ